MYILLYIWKLNLSFIIDEIKVKYIYIFITRNKKVFIIFVMKLKIFYIRYR